MGHAKTLSMKTMASGLPVFLILALVGKTGWIPALFAALVLTGIAYFVGDMLVLPQTGNLMATLADGALTLLLLWLMRFFGLPLGVNTILLAVLAVVVVEGLFYHPYLKRLVGNDSMGPVFGKRD